MTKEASPDVSNRRKTEFNKSPLKDSLKQRTLDDIDEENLKSVSMEEYDFDKYKVEQRTLMEKRNQIQRRIESMKREYDFI